MLRVLADAIADQKRMIIFGCSALGKELYEEIRRLPLSPQPQVVFMRNGSEPNETFCGVEVLSASELNNYREEYFILAAYRFYEEMEHQLLGAGVCPSNIIKPEQILSAEAENLARIVEKRAPRKKMNFVMDLAEHCNLNCQNCDHFSPLAKEHFTDVASFESDIKRMSEIFTEDQIEHIDLEGGEPLLNLDINNYIEIGHRFFPHTQIKIFTNGLLLPKMPAEFWALCRAYNVMMEVTQYPVHADYEAIRELTEQNGVAYHVYSGEVEKDSWHKPLDLQGTQDAYDSFNRCYLSNGECTMLKEGRLYPCTLIPNLSTFNAYFGKDLIVQKRDYINIYDDVTAEEVFEFLCQPVPACRYCKVREWTNGHEWHTSKRDIKEWT